MKRMFKKSTGGILFALIMILFAGVFSNCGDSGGGDEGPASLAGKYKFKMAKLTSEVVIQDQGSEATITLAVGMDVTNMVVGGLVGALACDNSNNGAIDLRTNNQLFAFCDGEGRDPMQGGTWSENATRTTLTLNLAPPLVPQAVQLVETNIVVAGKDFSGDVANMPMSGQLLEAYLDPALVPEGFLFPVIVLMDVKLEYTNID